MPAYPSAESLIADAELRLDRFGKDHGVLIVEGPDDKRLFAPLVRNRQQVVAAGGKGLLLAAQSLALEQENDRVLFLADCDYDVALENLAPANNLIITTYADVEADLLDLGAVRHLVEDLVPATLDSDEYLEEVVDAVFTRSVALSDVLGRARRVARAEGFQVETKSVRHHKYRRRYSDEVDEPKLIRTLYQSSPDCPLPYDELESLVGKISRGYANCNGHDLIAAIGHVLRDDFGVRNQTAESLEKLVRYQVPPNMIASWKVIQRIRRWEAGEDCQILLE
jgi:hypothetical protein